MASHLPGRDDVLPITFYKIILKTNLERLKIPKIFSRKYGSGLPNPLFIKPPDGTEWEVNWAKRNGHIWLEKGWKEFTQNYSLDHGHFVFFKYRGTSQIRVTIFGQNELEIEYPLNTRDEEDNLVQTEEETSVNLDEGQEDLIRGDESAERT